MDTKGKLDVTFLNFEHERSIDEKVTHDQFQRVKGVWNIYFHGFMDKRCDIAYVKKPTEISPGIYEVTVYGEAAYLFLWVPKDDVGGLKGLITRVVDTFLVEDAFKKYTANQSFI